MPEITMGNFFSGSGTWELACKLNGMKVLWESEIEPFPIALEAKRFPEATQLGDISKVNGAEIEPVDVMTNSSPCTNISVAGKRAGMEEGSGTASSLFHEVIRITKEMREHDRTSGRTDDNLRPRFWCWENVVGLFSSNKGEDFRKALEEIAQIVSPDAHISLPRGGYWSYSGCVDGDGFQIAWRVLDAQYFGVAQRRRRCFLVADFGGRCASEVLFKPESLQGYFTEIADSWKDTTRSLEDRFNETSKYLRRRTTESSNGIIDRQTDRQTDRYSSGDLKNV